MNRKIWLFLYPGWWRGWGCESFWLVWGFKQHSTGIEQGVKIQGFVLTACSPREATQHPSLVQGGAHRLQADFRKQVHPCDGSRTWLWTGGSWRSPSAAGRDRTSPGARGCGQWVSAQVRRQGSLTCPDPLTRPKNEKVSGLCCLQSKRQGTIYPVFKERGLSARA